MSYTYNEPESGVFTDDVSWIRYLINDTNPSAPFSLTDAQIEFEIVQMKNPDGSTNIRQSAGNVAYRMSMAYQKAADASSKSVGYLSLSYNYGAQAAAYKALSNEVRKGYDLGLDQIAGQIWYDTGDVEPQFHLRQFDYKNYPVGGSDGSNGSSGTWP